MIRDFGELIYEGNRQYWIIDNGRLEYDLTCEFEMFKHLGQRIPMTEELCLLMLGLKDAILLFSENYWYCREMITNV